MAVRDKLPVGIENFEEIRTEGFYYVDKTGLIRDLLSSWAKVNLFTRPRRFGKSLNMSMLKYFFGYGCDPRLFDGLMIAEEEELCQQYMGRFPVICVTLKGVASRTFEGAKAGLGFTVAGKAREFGFLFTSDRLSDEDKRQYDQLLKLDMIGGLESAMAETILEGSLLTLCRLLHKHYGQKVILLMDEYDVPLDQAQRCGYYDEMTGLIRNLFGQALKTNDSLYLAVLTGCLRIAKESIFTGLNNFRVFSVRDVRYDEYFGFSDGEVKDMLGYYGLEEKYGLIKEWYDGYRFGNADVYCPWDVINYVDLLRTDREALPRAFWINTSGNEIIRRFLGMAKQSTKREIEELIEGKSIEKKIREELTYRELYQSIDHVWSVLLATGYLTCRGRSKEGESQLAIPNLEIRKIYIEQVTEWFQEEAGKDRENLDRLCEAFEKGEEEEIERRFTSYLRKTISIRDTGGRKGRKENFYHGILVGLLSHKSEWDIRFNAESGDGYSDILVEIEEKSLGMVIEVKYVDTGSLERGCESALAQIESLRYEEQLAEDGMETILKYGIACRKKECRVVGVREQTAGSR